MTIKYSLRDVTEPCGAQPEECKVLIGLLAETLEMLEWSEAELTSLLQGDTALGDAIALSTSRSTEYKPTFRQRHTKTNPYKLLTWKIKNKSLYQSVITLCLNNAPN